MAIRTVRPESDEILRKRSKEVEEINDKVRELINDMVETMHKYDGIGLAAPQVGVLKRIIVIDLGEETEIIKLINPEIISQKGEQKCEEGCLSIPNYYAQVIRPKEIKVRGLDENGEAIEITAKEVMAVALAHEIDHLEGVLFKDKMIPGTMQYIAPEKT